MSFKIYKNKITGHASVSIRQRDKKRWYNLPMSHSIPNDSYIKVNDPHPNANRKEHSYVRKYVRKDKKGVKDFQYKSYRFSSKSEKKIKNYLKTRFKKKRWCQAQQGA